jgi:hypothetical protein
MGDLSKDEIENHILSIIKIRPYDYFILFNKLTNSYNTQLSSYDLDLSLDFLKDFQRLRDLLDDIMSIEEDLLTNSYNSISLAKEGGVSYYFFINIIEEYFASLTKTLSQIEKHKNKPLLNQTIEFWNLQYEILFKPLLINYYVNLEEFRKIYFMFKQV